MLGEVGFGFMTGSCGLEYLFQFMPIAQSFFQYYIFLYKILYYIFFIKSKVRRREIGLYHHMIITDHNINHNLHITYSLGGPKNIILKEGMGEAGGGVKARISPWFLDYFSIRKKINKKICFTLFESNFFRKAYDWGRMYIYVYIYG